MLSTKKIIILVAATSVFFIAVMLGTQYLAKKRALEALPVNTKMGGDFILPSTQGAGQDGGQGKLDTSTLRGKVVLLNFGFTSCPDVCPLVLARLKQVLKELGEDAAGAQVVFVSFDPERDSLPNLTAYVQHFDPRIIGATGSDAEIATVAAQYGVVYIKEKSDSASGYNFAHSDYIYLLDKQGRLRKLYANDAKTTEISADVRLLQSEGSLF
ncbi:MAG: SCO family protein [Pedobacter sp.]|nr:SCO family protein [Pedobacter sp.]